MLSRVPGIPFDRRAVLKQVLLQQRMEKRGSRSIAVGVSLMASGMMVTLVGVRSPLVVEYEECCARVGLTIRSKISLGGQSRLLDPSNVVEINELEAAESLHPCLPCAFVPERRRELADVVRSRGLTLAPALIDPTAILARSVRIGDGSFVNAGAIIGALSLLGEGVLVNRATSVGHHCRLGDYVSVGPGVTIASNVIVGDEAVIGAGAVVLPNVRIGDRAIVGGGALVRQQVADGTFVAGNPARERPFDRTRSSLYVEGDE